MLKGSWRYPTLGESASVFPTHVVPDRGGPVTRIGVAKVGTG
jgi:hypothetical protein